jgi:hypothetical protein
MTATTGSTWLGCKGIERTAPFSMLKEMLSHEDLDE